MPSQPALWEQDERDPFAERPGWTAHVSGPVFCLVAMLVFHLTASAPIAAMAFCAQFGSRWFLTALWLMRRDPNRARGLTCALFYLSSAMSTVMLAALVTTLFLIILFSWADRQADPTQLFIMMGILIGGGFLGAGLLSLAGVLRAAKQRQPVWVDPLVYWSYREDAWPPVNHVSGNRIENQVSMAQVFILLGLPIVYLLLLHCAPFGNNIVLIDVASYLIAAVCLSIPVFLFYITRNNVIALTARQCWKDAPASTGPRADRFSQMHRRSDLWDDLREMGGHT